MPVDPRFGDRGARPRLATTKAALRASALRARRDLDRDERGSASESAVARLAALPELRRARTVLLYA
ncbi:MAG: hypothetical protein ACRDSE_23200, partial [Pseudonocardiaceae bacterium]